MLKLMSKFKDKCKNSETNMENAAYFRLKRDLEDLKNYKLSTNQFLVTISDIQFDSKNVNYIIDLILLKQEENNKIDEYQVN